MVVSLLSVRANYVNYFRLLIPLVESVIFRMIAAHMKIEFTYSMNGESELLKRI